MASNIFQLISPEAFPHGIDLIFSVIVLLICIIFLILFAKGIDIIFKIWLDESELNISFYDIIRWIAGLGLILVAFVFGYSALFESNPVLANIDIGTAFTTFGIAISFLLSLLSDRQIRTFLES